MRPAPVSQESVSAITPHHPLPRFTSTPPDPRPQAAAIDQPPPPHPNPQESPRDARVTQAPAGAVNHEQIRAAVSQARLRRADLQRLRDCPAQRLGTRGAGRENPKEAVEIIIKADPELTRLEIGSDAIWGGLRMVARLGLRGTVTPPALIDLRLSHPPTFSPDASYI